jgi:8-oxo-dGTP diphosphatase
MINCSFENGHKALLRHVTVDVIVIKDNKVLLEKRAERLLEGGKWGLVGGFMERDESTKQAVERETMEETGYKVKGITLLTIRDNPDRPHEDRQNIAFVYFCMAVKKVGKSDNESSDIKWFDLNNLPSKEDFAFDHLESINIYLRYKSGDLKLPVI